MEQHGSRRWRRGLVVLVVAGGTLLSVAGMASPVGAASTTTPPASTARISCTAMATGGQTCTNTTSAGYAYNPATGHVAGVPRQVTVSKTSGLVSEVVNLSWKNFTPSSSVTVSANGGAYYVEVLECQTSAPTSLSQCFGSQSYPITQGDIAADSNQVFDTTGADSTQSVQFAVDSAAEEPSLGCDAISPCSLLVLPDVGGNNDTSCSDHSTDFITALAGTGNNVETGPDSHCNLAASIVVPLTFAATPDDCPSATPQFTTAGSPQDARAMNLWRAGLCSGSGALSIGYTDLGEYQARQQASLSGTDIALTTQPQAAGGNPVVYAPITNTAMSVSFYIDNRITGHPLSGLRLNARLLAKMLTQSYPGFTSTTNCSTNYACATYLAGNPQTIFVDPEFLRLNPTFTSAVLPIVRSAGLSQPTVAFGDTDSSYEITRWIESDPAAAAFLAGTPDPSGMKVNPAYLPAKVGGPLYPTSAFVANDPGVTKDISEALAECGAITTGLCRYQGTQLDWNPLNGLHNVATQLLGSRDSGRQNAPNCTAAQVRPPVCDTHPADPAETLGNRELFAITANADASAYQFSSAALQNRAGQFVSPTTAAISATVLGEKPASNGVASLDFANLTDPAAYPLTTTTYAMIPTCGLTTTKIAAIGSFLRYVASDAGQTVGQLPGNLAPGYAPLTAAQRVRTTAVIPALTTKACPTLTQAQITAIKDAGTGVQNGITDVHLTAPTTSDPAPASSASTKPEPQVGAPGVAIKNVAFGPIVPTKAGLAGKMVIILLAVGLALLLGGGPLTYLAATGRRVRVGNLLPFLMAKIPRGR